MRTVTASIPEHLQVEFEQVVANLQVAASALQVPLNEFVTSQIRAGVPHSHALVVLATAVTDTDNCRLHDARILLASALELLYVAHCIHKHLLSKENSDIDKSVMGSLILAGDYCFSHSAMLASQTEQPEVVRIFSQTLKEISEGNLRKVLESAYYFDEHALLFDAGVRAAGVLTGLEASKIGKLQELAARLAHRHPIPTSPSVLALETGLPLSVCARWIHIRTLLQGQT